MWTTLGDNSTDPADLVVPILSMARIPASWRLPSLSFLLILMRRDRAYLTVRPGYPLLFLFVVVVAAAVYCVCVGDEYAGEIVTLASLSTFSFSSRTLVGRDGQEIYLSVAVR